MLSTSIFVGWRNGGNKKPAGAGFWRRGGLTLRGGLFAGWDQFAVAVLAYPGLAQDEFLAVWAADLGHRRHRFPRHDDRDLQWGQESYQDNREDPDEAPEQEPAEAAAAPVGSDDPSDDRADEPSEDEDDLHRIVTVPSRCLAAICGDAMLARCAQ